MQPGAPKERGLATLKEYKGEPGEVARVKDGPATLRVQDVEGLPENTLLLGTLQLGEDRLFGTFTQAQIPGKDTVPVCLVVGLEGDAGFLDKRGKDYPCGPGLGTWRWALRRVRPTCALARTSRQRSSLTPASRRGRWSFSQRGALRIGPKVRACRKTTGISSHAVPQGGSPEFHTGYFATGPKEGLSLNVIPVGDDLPG